MKKKKKSKYDGGYSLGQKLRMGLVLCVLLTAAALVSFQFLTAERVRETEEFTTGIDVAKYQGTIDWAKAADYGVDFAMVRVGYRGMGDGVITADSNARYNMQEAQKYGIKLGVYFFSTAVSEEEAREEADWVADYISQYAITYPVAYDCEGYADPDSRQYGMNLVDRTDAALAFLQAIEKRGYEGMFYASKNELENSWETARIQRDYKIWVAQYSGGVDPALDRSSYEGGHQMWQYTAEGSIPGISQNVDLNIAYFGYDGIRQPKNKEVPEEAFPDVEALMDFTEISEQVTAKEETNLRSHPSQGEESVVLYTLKNGEVATRTAVSDSGWSRVEFNGGIYYAVSNFLTTDLSYTPTPTEPQIQDDTEFDTEFAEVNDRVTAKELVNLRNIPSVTREDSVVVAQLTHGEVVTRTGINEDVGWSRVIFEGKTLYCVTQYLEIVE